MPMVSVKTVVGAVVRDACEGIAAVLDSVLSTVDMAGSPFPWA